MNDKTIDDIQTHCATPRNALRMDKPVRSTYRTVTNPDLIGTLHHYPHLASGFVSPRNVEIWLPPGYDDGRADGYRVLYMHDGQNLFEPLKSYIGVDWGMDGTMTSLYSEGQIPPTIVVGIWNTPRRLREYLPQRPFCDIRSQTAVRLVAARYGGAPLSDAYLRFMVHELKPFVDSRYRTRPERAHTHVMGSSMGGLISLYAICEYPDVFGGAGCMSTHWPKAHKPLSAYLRARLPEPGRHKIYLDYGAEARHAGYRCRQQIVERILHDRGYEKGLEWISREYADDPHSETAWRNRVRVPLRFLLNNGRQRFSAAASPSGGARES